MIEFDVIKKSVWRAVEPQHKNSTRKLVSNNEEQKRLESLLDQSKPAVPPRVKDLHYLLFTPFRYIRFDGSRFRRPMSVDGILYTSLDSETCITEFTFYRLLFFAESPETSWPSNPLEASVFSIPISSFKYVRFHSSCDFSEWANISSYPECQDFADHVRAVGAEVIGYRSARDQNGYNVAILSENAFNAVAPEHFQTWRIRLAPDGVFAQCENPPKYRDFDPAVFTLDRRLEAVMSFVEGRWKKKLRQNSIAP